MATAALPKPPALWDPQWRRDKAPLLDELASSIDHVEAFAAGGAHDISNFATVCARCNARKSSRPKGDYLAEASPWTVKGKHGEPKEWDGLSSLFVLLARQSKRKLTPNEQSWLRALEPYVLEADSAHPQDEPFNAEIARIVSGGNRKPRE